MAILFDPHTQSCIAIEFEELRLQYSQQLVICDI
jgi:hypothetical protein